MLYLNYFGSLVHLANVHGKWSASSLTTVQSAVQYMPHSPINTHIHILMTKAAMQGANFSSEAIWGSGSFSRTLQHATRGSRDSN